MEPLGKEIKAARKNSESKKQTIAALGRSVADVKSEKAVIKKKVVESENKFQSKQIEFETQKHLKIELLSLKEEINSTSADKEFLQQNLVDLQTDEKDNIASKIFEKNVLEGKVEPEKDMRVKQEEFLLEMKIRQEEFHSTITMRVKQMENEILALKDNTAPAITEKEGIDTGITQGSGGTIARRWRLMYIIFRELLYIIFRG